jgi:hypothetical protein
MDDPGNVKPSSLPWKKHFLTRIYADGTLLQVGVDPGRDPGEAQRFSMHVTSVGLLPDTSGISPIYLLEWQHGVSMQGGCL